MEAMFKDMYNEIVIAGKLIVKLNQFSEEATEMPTELKSEISDTLDFLRDRARYYQQSYREEIAYQDAMETHCNGLPPCYECEYNCNCENMDIYDYEE